MKTIEMLGIALEVDRRVVNLREIRRRGMRCVEIVWQDGTTSLIPWSLFKGDRELFKNHLYQVKEIRDYLEGYKE